MQSFGRTVHMSNLHTDFIISLVCEPPFNVVCPCHYTYRAGGQPTASSLETSACCSGIGDQVHRGRHSNAAGTPRLGEEGD